MNIAETAQSGRSGLEVTAFFQRMEAKKVAFTEWENALVDRTAERFPHWNMLALNSNKQIAAAVLGGETLGLASISHMAVCPTIRRGGIGSTLVTQTVAHALRRTQAARVHLIVTNGNEEAIPFWARHGFGVSSEPTVELTVESAVAKPERNDLVQELDLDKTHQLLSEDPTLRARLSERERIAIADDLTRGSAQAWSVIQNGRHTAVMFSGSLGVRGIIRLFTLRDESDPAACAAMLKSGVAHITNLGVLRLHSFPITAREKEALYEVGFRVQHGETTMIRTVQ